MTRSEFITAITNEGEGVFTKKEAEEVLKAVERATIEAIKENDIVPFKFGKIGGKTKAARQGRNPMTGEVIMIPEKSGVPYFKASSTVKVK